MSASNLTDKLALVTGASSGIGAATARALAAAGARVVAAARRTERLEALADSIAESGHHRPEVLTLDVREYDAVHAALAERSFDVAVVNAGLAQGLEPLQAGDPDDWARMLDTNVKGLLHVVRATLPAMLAREQGDLVLLGSIAGRSVYPNGAVYCASKHAVRALYEGLREDAGAQGVRFTTVDPGLVETEFSEVRFHGDREKAAAVYANTRPLAPEDVADAILYAVTRPPHVNVAEVVLWPTDQISATRVRRSE